MISGAFVFQSLTLPPTTKPVEPSRKSDPFTITPVVRTAKTPSIAFWRKKHKKTRKHQAKPEKRVRIVFMSLHNYSRKQCAICFERSEGRTGQNSKLSHQKTVNGTRNFFAFRETLAGFGAQSRYCYIFNAPYLDHVRYYVMPPWPRIAVYAVPFPPVAAVPAPFLPVTHVAFELFHLQIY